MSDNNEMETLADYGKEFQTKVITCLITDRAFFERIYDILTPEYFEYDYHRWIVTKCIEYFKEFKNIATPMYIGTSCVGSTNTTLCQLIREQLITSAKFGTATDLAFVKKEFLKFCKHQKIKSAISDSLDLLKNKQFDEIQAKFDEALKAGLERNVGHEYNTGMEERMSASCRETIKTGWDIIDTALDGGMGKGELIFVVAPAGSGKCVSGNAKIEIQYYETGISIKGNSGKEHILWISPFEKIKFNDKILFGWQVDNILYELEKLQAQGAGTES